MIIGGEGAERGMEEKEGREVSGEEMGIVGRGVRRMRGRCEVLVL